MIKKILVIVFVFLVGMSGGIFSSSFILPRILENSFLGFDYQYLKRMSSGPINFTEKKEITVQENVALQDSIKKVEKSIVGISSKTKTGQTIYGSGLVLTSDGMAVALSSLVPKEGESTFYINGNAQNYQILRRDENKNLILLKFEENSLQPCGFADFKEINLGERIFLAGINVVDSKDSIFVNEGIIRFFNEDKINTNISEGLSSKGSALFNIRGELLGLNTVDKEARIETIPITFIREFAGF